MAGIFEEEFKAAQLERLNSKQRDLNLWHEKMTALAKALNSDRTFLTTNGMKFDHNLERLVFYVTSSHVLEVSVNATTENYIVSEPKASDLFNSSAVAEIVKFLARYSEEMFSKNEVKS
jgi:hypothetical protein